MKHRILLALSLLSAACGSTEPSAEELALAKVWVVHVDRPAGDVPFFIGATEGLTATAFDSAGVPMTVPLPPFRWESTDSASIRIDQDGRITAIKPGTSWIFARLPNGIYGYRVLGVSDQSRAMIINPDSGRMLPGQERTLVLQSLADPTLYAGQGWSSSNTAVATVSNTGVVTAIAPGVATVSVGFAGAIFKSEVYVAAVVTPLRFTMLSAGRSLSCGLTSDQTAYCWGSPESGALGSTERIDRCVLYSSINRTWNRMTTACATEPVRVQTPVKFASIDVPNPAYSGAPVACGLTSAGEAYCWGATAALGGTGGPAVVSVSADLRFTNFNFPCGVTLSNDAWCWADTSLRGSPATSATIPTQVPGAGVWRTVTGGLGEITHRCGLTTSGEAYCWGANGSGQLGTGNTTPSAVPVPVQTSERFTSVSVMPGQSCALSVTGSIYCWGAGKQLPEQLWGTMQFTALATGGKICGLRTDGVAYCTGLTVGDAAPGLRFRSLAIGLFHQCGIAQDGLAYCWGNDRSGQIGDGSVDFDRPSPLRVVGQ